ncbi:MAG: fused MFS/spermidine synthase [Bryobacterales bacterium]|nr:fused MFS/spermidine synthase [Bryobacterales bacterium]
MRGKCDTAISAPLVIDVIAVFLAAFLLFQIQPMISKYILPWFGGAPLVWATCLMFFQTVLLAGYSYAHVLVSYTQPRWQVLIHGALLVASLAALPGIPQDTWRPSGSELPALRILLLLGVTIGLPYFILASTSPLVQAWIARYRQNVVPYRLFSLSNLASIFGLLSYPFLIEPVVGLRHQFFAWSGIYLAYAIAMLVLSASIYRRASPAREQTAVTANEPGAEQADPPVPALKPRLIWMAFASCPSLLFLAFSNHLTQDVAPVPFLWVLPLVIYLLTFVIAFEFAHRLPLGFLRWASVVLAVALALSFVLPLLLTTYVPEVVLYCTALLVMGLFCHGELYARRPAARHLTAYYLVVSTGGALGGCFVALVAPSLFSGYYELYVGLALCAGLAFLVEFEKATQAAHDGQGTFRLTPAVTTPLFAAALVAGVPFAMAGENHVRTARNFFGAITVTDVRPHNEDPNVDNERYRRLDHGSTRHGLQFATPSLRCEATTYYGRRAGVGLLLDAAKRRKPRLRVGIIGLGAGTLAVYKRPSDEFEFFEINPLIETVAREDFTYLNECSKGASIHIGDGRIELEHESPQDYDVLIVDAFSGDSIPTHLLTQEAFRLYRQHLVPDGVIALNISNRYLQLASVVAAAAERTGFEAKFVLTPGDDDLGTFTSHWAIVTRESALLASQGLSSSISHSPQPAETILWTDDYSNLFRVLR